MAQAILISKVNFIGMTNNVYIHVTVKGKGVTINEVDRHKAFEIIENEGLIKAMPESYLGNYDRKLGSIYTDSNFQETINNDIAVKKFILNSL